MTEANCSPVYIGAADIESRLTWQGAMGAIRNCHEGGNANDVSCKTESIADTLINDDDDYLLTRSAFVPGLGFGIKAATIFPHNGHLTPPLPSIHSVVALFDHGTGKLGTLIDGELVTKFKTVADSVLGATILARQNSEILTIVGAGTIAEAAMYAYYEAFPSIRKITLWNRNTEKAEHIARDFASDRASITVSKSLQEAVRDADIVSSATMTTSPIILGNMIKDGTHVDLIGAYRPDMREADDTLIKKSELFVDSRKTTMEDIGEILIPLSKGLISEADIKGDLHDLCKGISGRSDDRAITLYKNGGGAHLDVMIAHYIAETYRGRGAI